MTVLVTGGAGYIGSAFVEALVSERMSVVVLDDLSTGHADAVPPGVALVRASVADASAVADTVLRYGVDVCVHFAGLIDVRESVEQPLRYYEHNVTSALSLLDTLLRSGVRKMVFSSTASVYGAPRHTLLGEDHPCRPVNPYGWSKLIVEQAIEDLERADGLRSVVFRYFNAAGATRYSVERHEPETHLIPNALMAAAGLRNELVVHGTDFDTPDGTAIRDYVHVADLADAHLRAVRHLREGGASERVNLGTGRGSSVLEVVAAVKRVTGRAVPVRMGPRRPGDPAELVARVDRARERLGWTASHTELDAMVRSAWEAAAYGRSRQRESRALSETKNDRPGSG